MITPVFVFICFLIVIAAAFKYGPCKSNTTTSAAFDDWRVQERWEDYPEVNYNAVHTYCKVLVDGYEKPFYYRTRNPNIKVGDRVSVPFGYKYEPRSGTVIHMKNYRGYAAPYPLAKTKHIRDKL